MKSEIKAQFLIIGRRLFRTAAVSVSLSMFLILCFPEQAAAITKTWDGGGATNNWSESANWSDDSAPTSGDDVVFDGTSTKNATVDVSITISLIKIASGYTGTITQSNAASIQVGPCVPVCFQQDGGTFDGSSNTITLNSNGFGGLTLNGGTFNGGSGDITIVPNGDPSFSDHNLRLLGGTFKSTSGNLTLPRSFNFQNPGSVFLHNNGTVTFTTTQNSALINDADHPSITFNNVNFSLASGANFRVIPRMIVLGNLALNDGSLSDNGSVIETRGDFSISPNFDGGNAAIEFGPGAVPRTFSFAVGMNFPKIVLNDPNLTINTSGIGTLLLPHQLIINQGTFNQGAVDLTITPLDIGGGACLQMGGGVFNGSSHLLTLDSTGFRTVFMLGGTFNGGSGDIIATGDAINTDHNIAINGGTFKSTSGTLFVARSFTVQNTGAFINNGGTVVFNSGTNTAILSDDGNGHRPSPVFNNVVFSKNKGSIMLFALTSIIVNGTLSLNDGVIDGLGGEVIEARGNVNFGANFDRITNNVKLLFAGSGNQTVALTGTQSFPGGWVVAKQSGAVTANVTNSIDLGSVTTSSGILNVNGSGTVGSIDLGSVTTSSGVINVSGNGTGDISLDDLSVGQSGDVNIDALPNPSPSPSTSGGAARDQFAGTPARHIVLRGNVSNNGIIKIEGGSGCPSDDNILIRSSLTGTQRNWSGSGIFRLVNVDVQDQGGTAPITVFSGTNSGNNGPNFLFDSGCPAIVTISPPSTTLMPGATQTFTAGGGSGTLVFSIPVNNSGASINAATGFYTAGLTPNVTDTVRVTDGFASTADATINIQNPTAAPVSVSGTVTTPDGRGLRNAIVRITDAQNLTRTVTTSSFGLYSFGNVQPGQIYTIRVLSKLYRFSSRTVTVGNSDLTGINFTGVE